jgi:CheY-like chemotaxis protein
LITRYSLEDVKKPLRILLADDNAINRELTFRILSKRGHSVTMVPNGKKALEALTANDFDLILMDVQMPEMDGFEATAAIRRKEGVTGAHLPIIAMTAHAMKGDRERCLAAGMDGYISKPIQAEELLKMTESLAGDHVAIDMTYEPTRPVWDHAVALARVDGDETLLCDLARLFCEECPKMLASIRPALSAQDAQQLERSAHSLKGSVATFAAQDAYDAALKLERLARARDLTDAEGAYATLAHEVDRLKLALEGLIAKSPASPKIQIPVE